MLNRQKLPQGVAWQQSNEYKRLLSELEFFEKNPNIYNDIEKLLHSPRIPFSKNKVNSYVAYLLNITSQICDFQSPLAIRQDYYLTRYSPPDIDVDFIDNTAVYEYVISKYGKDHVANVGTWNSWQLKAALQDAVKINHQIISEKDEHGNPLTIDQVAKAISKGIVAIDATDTGDDDNDEKDLLDLLLQQEHVQKYYAKYPKVFEDAQKMLGIVRYIGKHAAGIVISDVPINEIIPLHRGSKGERLTQFDKEDLESIGLLKMDILGLKNLRVIYKCKDLVRARTGVDIDVRKIKPHDPRVYDMLSQGFTQGVFQFEGYGMTKLLKQIQPTGFSDLVAAVALYRPGPLQNHFDVMYTERKNDPSKIAYAHPALENSLKNTLGIFLYQEQIMEATRLLAGFSYTESDEVRKIIGKKQLDKLPQLRKKFVSRAVEFGLINEQSANMFFDQLEAFGKYAFNLAHSSAYSLIAYYTAFFKTFYSVEFFASLMSVELHHGQKKTQKANEKSKLDYYMAEAEKFGISFLPPSMNESKHDYIIEEDKKIRMPLGVIKGVGGEAEKDILSNQPYNSIGDFIRRTNINSAVLEVLIEAGVWGPVATAKRLAEREKMQKDKLRLKNSVNKTTPNIPASMTQTLF